MGVNCCREPPISKGEDELSPTEQTPELEEDVGPIEWQPLVVSIVAAKDLRKADWLGKSDPFCICEVVDKPLARFITDTKKKTIHPEWDQEGLLSVEPGDDLEFKVYDEDRLKWSDFLGWYRLESSQFWPHGFEGWVPLNDAGKGIHAFLQLRILAAEQVEKKAKGKPALTKAKASTTYTKLPASGNANKPADFEWLRESITKISESKGEELGCSDLERKVSMTPLFVVYGQCPNSFCGMQAVIFCVDKAAVIDFWWVKPTKKDPNKVEPDTLKKHIKGANKNDPGRSAAVYQPLATLFEKKKEVNGWTFGLEPMGGADKPMRAFIMRTPKEGQASAEEPEKLYVLSIWLEDFTTNPFARSKYMKGKIIYQREAQAGQVHMRQVEVHDGAAFIAEVEEDPMSDVIGTDAVKVVWDLKLIH